MVQIVSKSLFESEMNSNDSKLVLHIVDVINNTSTEMSGITVGDIELNANIQDNISK